jgi:hypothetical protein
MSTDLTGFYFLIVEEGGNAPRLDKPTESADT